MKLPFRKDKNPFIYRFELTDPERATKVGEVSKGLGEVMVATVKEGEEYAWPIWGPKQKVPQGKVGILLQGPKLDVLEIDRRVELELAHPVQK